MPGLRSYLASQPSSNETDPTSQPEHINLHLPSSIPVNHRQRICNPGLPNIEDQLRYAQAIEALSGLRRQLRTRMMASKLNCKNASSQRSYVRSRTLQDQVEVRVRQCQRQYNTARAAVLALRGPGDWEKTLAILMPNDVWGISEHAMTAEEQEEYTRTRQMAGVVDQSSTDDLSAVPVVSFDPRLALGEGRRTLSWIWYTVSDQELQGSSQEVEASTYRSYHPLSLF